MKLTGRKTAVLRIAAAATAIILAGSAVSCAARTVHTDTQTETAAQSAPCEFTADGMKITLTEDFTELKTDKFAAAFGSKDVGVYIIRERFADYDGFDTMSVEKYGSMMMQSNGITDRALMATDDLRYFEYEHKDDKSGREFGYHSFIFKGPDSFWIVQFASEKPKNEAYSEQILKWAKSVTFDATQTNG